MSAFCAAAKQRYRIDNALVPTKKSVRTATKALKVCSAEGILERRFWESETESRFIWWFCVNQENLRILHPKRPASANRLTSMGYSNKGPNRCLHTNFPYSFPIQILGSPGETGKGTFGLRSWDWFEHSQSNSWPTKRPPPPSHTGRAHSRCRKKAGKSRSRKEKLRYQSKWLQSP